MRRPANVLLLSLLLLLLFAPTAFATYPSLSAPAPVERTGAHDVAVIVAVEDYIFLPDVRGAITNGNDWESFFQRSLGVQTVHFLSNSQATKEGMERFARMAAESAHPEGTLWFVFIGHGAPGLGGEDGLLIGVDTQQDTDSMIARGLPQQYLLDILHEGRQAQTVLVVDACFSGRDSSGEALVEAMPVVPMGHSPSLQASTLVFSAAQATEFAGPLPGADRPAFSYLLLGALRGWAADGSEIRAGDALGFTQRALRGLPGRFQQTPSLAGSQDLVLVRGAREADPGIAEMMRRSGRGTTQTISTVATSEGCDTGMIRTADTRDNCCWHGQVWSNNQSQCIGIPTECPVGLVPDAVQQACVAPACSSGQVRAEGGTACCWPGQAWSQLRQECVGVPTSCPSSYEVYQETCLPSRMVSSGVSGSVSEGTVRGDRYQSFTLAPGFLPDPAVGNGLSGGSVDARQLGSTAHGPCVGHIASSADHHVTLQASFRYLHFRAYSDTDTSLVIRGPGGQLYCNDDAVGLDPVIEGAFPAGDYEVFVGRVGANAGEYRLEITEIGTASSTPGSTPLVSNFEDARLAPGFLPDPHELSGYSGGANNARNLGTTSHGPCRGDIATNPDHLLIVERPFEYLRIRGYSQGDTSLVIRGPNGSLLCNDDAVGLDPQIEGPFPAGTYQIYVGAVGDAASYRLEISEFADSSARAQPQPSRLVSNFDDARIAPGFLPDPHVLTGAAGGNNDARPLGNTRHGACVGHIANNPDHLVELTGSFNYLRFRVFSDEDTTLVIQGPDGQLYCNDDSVGLDPQIEDSFPAGTYQVWIGTYSSGAYPDYRLELSEFRP